MVRRTVRIDPTNYVIVFRQAERSKSGKCSKAGAFSRLGAGSAERTIGLMEVSDESLRTYIEIYKREFGEELTIAEARLITARLIALYELLCRPLPRDRSMPPP